MIFNVNRIGLPTGTRGGRLEFLLEFQELEFLWNSKGIPSGPGIPWVWNALGGTDYRLPLLLLEAATATVCKQYEAGLGAYNSLDYLDCL